MNKNNIHQGFAWGVWHYDWERYVLKAKVHGYSHLRWTIKFCIKNISSMYLHTHVFKWKSILYPNSSFLGLLNTKCQLLLIASCHFLSNTLSVLVLFPYTYYTFKNMYKNQKNIQSICFICAISWGSVSYRYCWKLLNHRTYQFSSFQWHLSFPLDAVFQTLNI